MLEIKNLHISLVENKNHQRPMVRQVSLQVSPHRPFTLIGETGCGKSLIAHAIFNLLPPEMKVSGCLRYLGRNLLNCSARAIQHMWGREVFLFPQEPGTALNPLCRSRFQVSEIFKRVCDTRLSRAKSRDLWIKLFHQVGLSARDGKKFPWQLSGGMNQRVLAVMAMAEPARLVVADEPTKGLDPAKRQVTLDLLRKMSDMGKGLLVISHDLEVPRQLGGDLAVMYAGTIMESGPADIVLNQPRHPYTRALLKALPENGLHPIPLKINGHTFQGGCLFSPRCKSTLDQCFHLKPPEHTMKSGLTVSLNKNLGKPHDHQPNPSEKIPHIIRCHHGCAG